MLQKNYITLSKIIEIFLKIIVLGNIIKILTLNIILY